MPAECAQAPLGLYLPNNSDTFRFSFGFNVQVERVTKNKFTEKKKITALKKDIKNWLEKREYTGGQHQAGQNYLARLWRDDWAFMEQFITVSENQEKRREK